MLMEHGLSSNLFLSFLQKALDPLAYRLVGCHQNREMMNLICSSDLVVEKVESHWAGVVNLVWARESDVNE
ncbi:hypothetical protein [Polycladomyces subterraneus]|uniref:Uncharacterized protein n=1 Tax=Polycladomyces subterraneus TaxID=1016997 RepID=A0ABT8IPT2_9BACL|nr:hypothetical protein [Polycladomyces subterraneus]MDN4594762.1 hypothetical protein [Polycladomyces subterraneus]